MSKDFLLHVTASVNRASILKHGLDWKRMGAACGIAGAIEPEQEGIFLCHDEWEADWFAGFGQVRPVDVWQADIRGLKIEEEQDGFLLYRGAIAPERLKLMDVRVAAPDTDGPSSSISLPRVLWPRAPAMHWTRIKLPGDEPTPPGVSGDTLAPGDLRGSVEVVYKREQ